MTNPTQTEFEQLANAIKEVKIQFFELVKPATEPILNWLAKILDWPNEAAK